MLGLGSTPCLQWTNVAAAIAEVVASYACAPDDSACQQGPLVVENNAANSARANGGCITGNAYTTLTALAPNWVRSQMSAAAVAPSPTSMAVPASLMPTSQATTPAATSTPAMIPGAGTSAAMTPSPSPAPSAIQPVTSTPVVPVAATSTTTSTGAPAASSSSGSAAAATTGSTIIPGIPDTYVYLGGAALVLFMLMGGKK